MSRLFVAIGDSFTEGVGDWDPRYPNGVRGWADRVAKQLSKQDPTWRYANLAIRSKRLRQIIDEQLQPALDLRPTLVSVYAGGNDILELRTSMTPLMESYEEMVARIAAAGARPLLFTGFDVRLHPVLEPMRRRNWIYNEHVRRIAETYNALLVDYWCFDEYHDPRYWDSDRLHMSPAGHKNMAAHVLRVMGVDHTLTSKPLRPRQRPTMTELVRKESVWLREWVIPMFGRRLRKITLGDHLQPRWPEPIRPADGLKRLAAAREALLAPQD
ncbi:SGNH/GDSL hydrolase family protein [Arthrobacter sp. JZ12]|uniref:SGNH/GDSL hydrolase family protein n=1 Tax=Arthrobacter sp. JZ12 TaxID=2654190 RepID=UPI002B47400F|nr:SGNH/GDSL hydrolase family protein [Arthrobacter sp. JZ12]WRH26095.1 SGNH/GDSL hydrolase family protein [Arthrobacter sp. JZ12]